MKQTLIASTLALGTLAALAACVPDNDANADGSGTASESTAAESTASGGATPTAIPEGMQGRWGLVPADCEPGRADAKGLMVVEGNQLTFYESRATLDTVLEGDADTLRASFDFTGEGQEWNYEEHLELQEDGTRLIREESGEGAIPGPLEYSRCS